MRRPLKIIFVGLPGSGKSTFGSQIAQELNFDFIDLDQYIESKEERKISEIFEEEGEGGFRELETHYLQEVLQSTEGFVLSTGGGTPCFNDNMDLINQSGVSIYLDISMEEIYRRLSNAPKGVRPLFAGLGEGEVILKLKDLLASREPYYLQAKIKLSGEDISTEHLTSALMGYFKN